MSCKPLPELAIESLPLELPEASCCFHILYQKGMTFMFTNIQFFSSIVLIIGPLLELPLQATPCDIIRKISSRKLL